MMNLPHLLPTALVRNAWMLLMCVPRVKSSQASRPSGTAKSSALLHHLASLTPTFNYAQLLLHTAITAKAVYQ
ncbi:hypothetical protein BC567DRAFT_224685 [Phyllosticta citribraziliensis]